MKIFYQKNLKSLILTALQYFVVYLLTLHLVFTLPTKLENSPERNLIFIVEIRKLEAPMKGLFF